MVNLDELILRSQELCDRLLLLKKESEKGEDLREDEAERIRLIARSHPIRDHILCAADEHVRRLYMTALCSVIDKEADLARRTEELILAGRVLASFDAEADLSEYISGALKIDADFIGNFSESVEGDTAVAFAVDALLLCKLAGGTNEDMLELATEYISVSDVDAEMFSEICVLVKGILLQDDDAILKMKDMNLNPFVGYMRDAPDGFIVTDFKKLDNAPPRDGLFIANAEISDLEDVIDLDSYGAKSITFYGCRFSNIKGLKSETATVNFEKCGFDRIVIAPDEKRCKFIDMSACRISECAFTNCSVSESLIKIEEGDIESCQFNDCRGVDFPNDTCLINIHKGNLRASVLEQCNMETNRDKRSRTGGGLVLLQGGQIANCKFLDCSASGRTSYGKFSEFNMYVVKLVSARIEDSEFTKCGVYREDVYDATVKNYILALSSATHTNTNFNECHAVQYKYNGNPRYHNNVGEIS